MEQKIAYRGRQITSQDITYIKELIAKNPGKSRWFLSRELCRLWDWRQQNGALKDMICRGLMLKLQSDGFITLPPQKRKTKNPFLKRKPPEIIEIDQSHIECRVGDLQPIELRSVRKTEDEKLYNSLIQQHHYLRYNQPVGENLKYIAFSKDRPIACMGWTSAVRHLGGRDRFIGWPQEIRKRNIHFIAYNSRFLILPWVQTKFLASHLLSLCSRTVPNDWKKFYKHPIHLLETFVDTEKFKGTCYKAANWLYVGNTTGRGKNDQTHKKNRSIKAIYVYPIGKNFRGALCH